MATLRIDDTRRVAPGQAPGQFSAPDASQGAQFAARQAQAAGQAIQQAGQVAANIYTAEREKLNEARVNEALNQAQTAALDAATEYTQLRGAAAMRVGEDELPVDEVYTARFDERVTGIAEELNLTDEQRRRYQQAVQPLALRFRSGASSHLAAQAEAYHEDVDTTTVASAQQAVFADPDNAEVWGDSAARITQATSATGQRLGWTAERTALMIQERTGKAVLDVIVARADEDPRGAQDMLDRHRDDMTPAQQAAARNSTAGGLATQDASAWVSSVFANAPPPPAGAPGASFQMPLDGVSLPGPGDSDYGPRGSFRTSNGRQASSNHDGVDFSAQAGSAVRASAGGRVLRAGPNGGYGNFVEIDHGNGVVVGYAHLQDFDVKEGDTVAPGQTFGRVGSTGNSTGPHLHMRARRNGQSINPAELFSEEGRAAAEAGPPASRPTRAEMERRATERFGTNPVQLAAARSEIARVYSMDAAEKAERERNALDAAYRHMEQTRTAPPASMMANLPPGSENTVRNYLEALTAPPTVRSDPTVLMALAANPELAADMRPEEIVATYGRDLSSSDMISLIGSSARASQAARNEAASADHVPQTAFASAWTSTLDVLGIDRTPSGRDADADRQALAQINVELRTAIIARQRTLGRQLHREEIASEIQTRLGRLAWERPQGIFAPRSEGYQTSYDTLTRDNRVEFTARARERLGRNPTEAEVFQAYITDRIRGR